MALPEPLPTRRATWARVARLLVSGVLLAVLASRIHPENLLPEHRTLGTLAFLSAGIACMAGSFVLAAWRWQRVLAVFGCHVDLRVLVKHCLAGQFVGNVLPSTVGGDVLRVSRSAKDTGARDVAFAAVALERLTGFLALPLLSVVGFVVQPELFDYGRSWIALAIAGSSLVILGLILFLAGNPKLAGRFAGHESWMRYIGAVHVGVDRLRRDRRDAAVAVWAAVAYQVSVVAAVYCAVHTFDLRIPNAAVLAFVPAVAMVQVLPISVSGLGIREGMLALFLHPLGVPTGQAVAVGLLWYAITLLVSLAGAPAFAMGHRQVPVARAAGAAVPVTRQAS